MNTKEKAELMLKFYRNECELLVKSSSIGWMNCTSPSWNWVTFSYKEKVHPMQKYIKLGLDMEFCALPHYSHPQIGKLIGIDLDGIFRKDYEVRSKHCRLRPNHVHYIRNTDDIDPVPDNCEFRFSYETRWTAWYNSYDSNRFEWADISLIEIKYLK